MTWRGYDFIRSNVLSCEYLAMSFIWYWLLGIFFEG